MNTIRPFAIALLAFLSVQEGFVRPAVGAGSEDLTAQGVRLRRDGRDQAALPLFEEAVRQRPNPRGFAQLGFCEQALGLWVAAEVHILASLKSPRDPWIIKNQGALHESLSVVQGKLGSIDVWGTPEGARLSVDGQRVASLPMKEAIRAAEGHHVLTIEAPNFVSDSRSLNVRGGVLIREHVALSSIGAPSNQPLSPAALQSSDEPDPLPSRSSAVAQEGEGPTTVTEAHVPPWRRVLPWALLTVAVAAGSIAVWQHTVWYNGLDRFDAIGACSLSAPGRGADVRCQGLYDEFSRSRMRTFVGYGVAGILSGGAVALFILNSTRRDDAIVSALRLEINPGMTALSLAETF
jgi:hypothetical protein